MAEINENVTQGQPQYPEQTEENSAFYLLSLANTSLMSRGRKNIEFKY